MDCTQCAIPSGNQIIIHHIAFTLPDGARRRVLGGRDGRDAGRAAALPHGEEDGLPAAGGQN